MKLNSQCGILRVAGTVMGAFVLSVTAAVAALAQEQSVKITLDEGVDGLVQRDWPSESVPPTSVSLQGAGAVTLKVQESRTENVVWQKDMDLLADQPLRVDIPVPFGVYRITATGADGTRLGEAWLGVIPPFHVGIRKDSFFASNTSNLREGRELDLLEAIGMKVQRVHFQNVTPEKLENQRRRNTWVLPIVGYANPLPKSEWANKLNEHGPPADFEAFVAYWKEKLEAFPEVTTWEFWNEPWIFSWTWADTPAEYRRLQRMWAEMAHKVNPALRMVAGNSWMFVQDHIAPYPDSWKGLLSGTSHHPYSDAAAMTFRGGAYQRSTDAGYLVTRGMGLSYYYLTEAGTVVGTTDFGGSIAVYQTPNNPVNARKIVHLFVQSALTGVFQGNTQWGIGYGPGWTQSNASLAVLTHLLEDRPIVADIWPRQGLLRGAVFAHPRHVDAAVRALPRADELSARWTVPVPLERADDNTKVAVVWSWTGSDNQNIDRAGALVLSNPTDLRAYDLFGRPVGVTAGGVLRVPFSEDPVYLLSEVLSVTELRDRIGGARIENITPVNVYAQSLRQSADQAQTLTVRLDNQMNCRAAGELRLVSPGLPPITASWKAGPGELVDIPLDWPGMKPSADNRYAVVLNVSARGEDGRDLGTVQHSQVIQSARFVRRSIRIDGDPDDWQSVTPITVTGRPKVDFTRFLLNPNLPPPDLDKIAKAEEKSFQVRTAYDDENIYVAVSGLGIRTEVGAPRFEGFPWRKGMPDGLQFVQYEANTVQVAFGFRDRVPGHGRQLEDPWAWKGQFYDTDYLYAVHPTIADGDLVIRQWGPDTDRRTAYQTESVPYVQPVPGARAVLKDGFWEFAIPRREVAMFDPEMGGLRFGIVIDGTHNWSDTAGVFDYWTGSGSFNPSWEFRLPAQTLFGIE